MISTVLSIYPLYNYSTSIVLIKNQASLFLKEPIKILPQRRKGNAKLIKALRLVKDLSAFAVNKKASQQEKLQFNL
jgi:hypothetical protein